MGGRFTHKNRHGNKKKQKMQKGIVLNPRVPMRYSSSLGALLVIRRVYWRVEDGPCLCMYTSILKEGVGGKRSGRKAHLGCVLYIDDDLFSNDVGGRTQKKGMEENQKRELPNQRRPSRSSEIGMSIFIINKVWKLGGRDRGLFVQQ